MAQTPEGKIKTKIGQWLVNTWPDIYMLRYPAGMFGRTGVPDILCCIDGIFVGIEAKTQFGDPTALQLANLKAIKKAGGIPVLIRGFDIEKLTKLRNLIEHRLANK